MGHYFFPISGRAINYYWWLISSIMTDYNKWYICVYMYEYYTLKNIRVIKNPKKRFWLKQERFFGFFLRWTKLIVHLFLVNTFMNSKPQKKIQDSQKNISSVGLCRSTKFYRWNIFLRILCFFLVYYSWMYLPKISVVLILSTVDIIFQDGQVLKE